MPVSLDQYLLVPPVAALAALLALWLLYDLRRRRQRRRGKRHDRIYRCAACRHVYVDARRVPLAACPRCGALNEALRG
jgi:rRNA maturation endonuclease Nob1